MSQCRHMTSDRRRCVKQAGHDVHSYGDNETTADTFENIVRQISPSLAKKVWCEPGVFHDWMRKGWLRRLYCCKCGDRRV